MPYIGNTVQNQGFTPAIDYFSGNGVTVTFTLSRPVVSASQMIVTVDNVVQNPSSAFTVSGSSITFTSAPLSGTNNIWVEYTSLITTYNAISQDPSVIGDLTASGGFLSTGDFGNSYIDGTIVDYVTGNARITTGPADGLTIYNGGTTARTALAAWDTSGRLVNTGAVASNGGPVSGNSLVAGRIDASSEGGQLDLCRSTDNTSAWALDVYGSTSTPALRVIDNVGSAEIMRWTQSGTLILKGGSTSATGTGITFPAAQSASTDPNTLDDYEEGTWTPTLTNSTGYDQQYGRYVKVGRIVRLQAVINTTSFNNVGSTPLEIGGFPFTIDYPSSLSIYPLGHLFPVVGWNFSAINAIMVQGTPNTAKCILYYVTSGTGSNYNNVFASQMASGQVNCEFAMTYISLS